MSRIHAITVVVGQKGVGKTFLTNKVIENYRKNKPVLIFDTNHEDVYKNWESLKYDALETDDFKRGEIIRDFVRFNEIRKKRTDLYPEAFVRKIIPLLPDGKPMTRSQKAETVITILDNFTNGLVVLEDINSIQQNFHTGDIVDKILTHRHSGLDIVLHFQSLKRVAPILLENTLFLRLQKQADSVTTYANRFANYPLIRIAEIIINKQYLTDNRYFLFVNLQENKIIMEKNTEIQAEAIDDFLEESPKYRKQVDDFYNFFRK